MDARTYANRPDDQRRAEIEADFNRIGELQKKALRNRHEIKSATADLVTKVNGHGYGLCRALTAKTQQLDMKDPSLKEEFDEAGGKDGA